MVKVQIELVTTAGEGLKPGDRTLGLGAVIGSPQRFRGLVGRHGLSLSNETAGRYRHRLPATRRRR